jgi:predicted ATP-dependent serine protease
LTGIQDRRIASITGATSSTTPLTATRLGPSASSRGVVDLVGARDDGEITGVPTGFTDLDALTKGFQPGQLIVLAGRPAMGKSTVALDFARAAAIEHGRSVAIFPRRGWTATRRSPCGRTTTRCRYG